MVQQLELGAFTMVAQVKSLVGELIPHKQEKKINKLWNFLGGTVDENLPVNAGDTGWLPGLGRFHMRWSN